MEITGNTILKSFTGRAMAARSYTPRLPSARKQRLVSCPATTGGSAHTSHLEARRSTPGLCPYCAQNENGQPGGWPLMPINIGRDAEIRTRDPLTPSQVRYQAALHPDP